MDGKDTQTQRHNEVQARSYEFALRVLRLSRALDGSATARAVSAQVLRSGTAIGANVEEAQGAQSKKDFVSKMAIARKEAYETYYWLRLLRDGGIMPEKRLAPMIDECDQLCRLLSAIILSAQSGRARR